MPSCFQLCLQPGVTVWRTTTGFAKQSHGSFVAAIDFKGATQSGRDSQELWFSHGPQNRFRVSHGVVARGQADCVELIRGRRYRLMAAHRNETAGQELNCYGVEPEWPIVSTGMVRLNGRKRRVAGLQPKVRIGRLERQLSTILFGLRMAAPNSRHRPLRVNF